MKGLTITLLIASVLSIVPAVQSNARKPLKPSFEPPLSLGGAGPASMVVTQSAGRFTATGNMSAPRFLHTATLLADGRVLITGGEMIDGAEPRIVFKPLASAEIYHPVTGRFTATGNMTTPSTSHTATLLSDGKVLITGGIPISDDAGYSLTRAELYDPATGTFAATGKMTTPRFGGTATLLNNGQVLIAGGAEVVAGQGYRFLASAELYDPSAGTFTATGEMTEPTAETATLLANGKVLITRNIAPGPEGIFLYVSHAELYDPLTGTFVRTGDMNTQHSGPTATLLTNGKVLVAGGDIGDGGDGASTMPELYDPTTGTFTPTGNMITGRDQHTATLLADGRVLMVGGHNILSLANSAEVYDPVTGTFSITGGMATVRELHTATLLNNGKVLITGGDNQRYWSPDTILSSAELYDPNPPIPVPRIIGAAVSGKKLIVVGENFASGAVILISGEEQKTRNDDQNPQTTLIGKKAGKKIQPGDTLQVRNPDGTLSEEFVFTGS